jgi:hypothetical protein
MTPEGLRPIAEARGDRPVLGYFPHHEPRRQYAVIEWNEDALLWYLAHGGTFLGHPTHFKDL